MKDASFLDKPKLNELLHLIPDESTVIIDGSNSVFMDDDIVEIIEDFIEVAPERNIQVSLEKSTLALHPLFKE
jgi:MFS superfamily sulfate permease-like transporter